MLDWYQKYRRTGIWPRSPDSSHSRIFNPSHLAARGRWAAEARHAVRLSGWQPHSVVAVPI
jgi:hypothetical protein